MAADQMVAMASLQVVMNKNVANSSKPTKIDQPFRLLDLPPELRLWIYDLVFASIAFHPTDKNTMHITAAMRTCRQILQEASLSFLKYEIWLLQVLQERRRKELRVVFSMEWKSATYRQLQIGESAKVEKRHKVEVESILRMERVVQRAEQPTLEMIFGGGSRSIEGQKSGEGRETDA